jgi:uncharacterized lipoprotein YddW (UPF0748 family)
MTPRALHRWSVVLALMAGASLGAAAAARPGSQGAVAGGEVRGLWVVRDSLASRAAIESVVQRAVANGFNTLFVQVRGRGDAYYTSGIEPRGYGLDALPAAFDPLSTILDLA